ncbi:uncharacterized protein LOC144168836 [Haemaphysalis longicornis]
MTRTPCTSKYSALLFSSMLAVVVGSALKSERHPQPPVEGTPPAVANKASLQSHEQYHDVATENYDHLDTDNELSWQAYAPQVEPQPDAKFLNHISFPRDMYGYLDKNIPCRNESSGCRVILPDEEAANYSPLLRLSRFFLCLATVVCRDECTLKCTAPVEDSVPEKPLVPAEKESEQLVKFEKNVTSQVDALDVKLAKLIEELDSQKNKLVEIGHQLNRFNDTLQKKLRAATASTLESLDSKTREVKALLNEKTEAMTTMLSSVISTVAINPTTHRWTLTGYAGYKAKAIETGRKSEMGEKAYLKHYLISWGIYMKAEDGHVNLYLVFQLNKGRNDEFLDWPFTNRLKLCLIHPETQKEECATHKPTLAGEHIKFFARPLKGSNERVYLKGAKFESSYIEENGYTKEDKLFLKLEVLT